MKVRTRALVVGLIAGSSFLLMAQSSLWPASKVTFTDAQTLQAKFDAGDFTASGEYAEFQNVTGTTVDTSLSAVYAVVNMERDDFVAVGNAVGKWDWYAVNDTLAWDYDDAGATDAKWLVEVDFALQELEATNIWYYNIVSNGSGASACSMTMSGGSTYAKLQVDTVPYGWSYPRTRHMSAVVTISDNDTVCIIATDIASTSVVAHRWGTIRMTRMD